MQLDVQNLGVPDGGWTEPIAIVIEPEGPACGGVVAVWAGLDVAVATAVGGTVVDGEVGCTEMLVDVAGTAVGSSSPHAAARTSGSARIRTNTAA